MTVRVQNPDATQTLQELYDIVGELKVSLDEIISPVALVDDGWRRVTYIAFAETIAASTSANDRPLHAPSPDFSFQLLYLQLTGTGNLAGTVSLKLDPQAVLPGTDIGYADIVLDGVADPEQHRSLANLGSHQPTAPPQHELGCQTSHDGRRRDSGNQRDHRAGPSRNEVRNLSLRRLNGLEPVVQEAAEYALDIARYYGINPTVTSGFRSMSEQRRLRRRWEQGLSRFPANRPGESSHNFGLAFDSTVPAAQLPAWNAIRSWVGFELLPNDIVHAQVRGWRNFV